MVKLRSTKKKAFKLRRGPGELSLKSFYRHDEGTHRDGWGVRKKGAGNSQVKVKLTRRAHEKRCTATLQRAGFRQEIGNMLSSNGSSVKKKFKLGEASIQRQHQRSGLTGTKQGKGGPNRNSVNKTISWDPGSARDRSTGQNPDTGFNNRLSVNRGRKHHCTGWDKWKIPKLKSGRPKFSPVHFKAAWEKDIRNNASTGERNSGKE